MSSGSHVQQEIGDITATDGSTVIAGYNALSVVVNVDGTIFQQASLVGVPSGALRIAQYLATSAIGWFKAPETTKTLVDVLRIHGTELKAPSSFSFQRYRGFRERCDVMQGVFVTEGFASPITLPKASTGISDRAPISCLRAVTVCLICLCSRQGTLAILQQLIPYGLLRHDLEDAKLDFEGPLLASLNQWVESVTLEEENNRFKDHLLECVDKSLARLRPGPGFFEILAKDDEFSSGEKSFILGVMKWAITPEHQRNTAQYPTRSLRAWMAASIMSHLGFTIFASESVVGTKEEYHNMGASRDWSTFLVVFSNSKGTVDALSELVPSSDRDNPLPSRAILLRDVPHFVFRQLGPIDYTPVREAYDSAFHKAVAGFAEMKVELTSDLKIRLRVKHGTDIYRVLKKLGRGVKPTQATGYRIQINERNEMLTLESVLEACEQPIDESSPPRTAADNFFQLFYSPEKPDTEYYIKMAKQLGALYGICSCACRAQGGPLQGDSEISFSPENIRKDNFQYLTRWSERLTRAIFQGVSYRDWRDLIFEMFVGANVLAHGGPSTATASSYGGPGGYNTKANPEASSESYRSPDWVFGVQSHGFTAVSDTLVSIRMEPSSLGVFHITRGQLLNLSYDPQGYLRGPTSLQQAEELQALADIASSKPTPLSQLSMDSWTRDEDTASPLSIRLDIEPFWEDDPQTLILKAQDRGIPLASLYMPQIIHRMATNMTRCVCDAKNKRVVDLRENEKWFPLRVGDLSTYAITGIKTGKLANLRPDFQNYILDASGSLEQFNYALGIIDSDKLIIARDCISCAYYTCGSYQAGGTVIVIAPPKQQNSEATSDNYDSSDEE